MSYRERQTGAIGICGSNVCQLLGLFVLLQFSFFSRCVLTIYGATKPVTSLSGFEIVGFKSQRRANGGKNSFCRQRRTGPIIMICLLRDEAGDQEQEQADFRQASRTD